MQLLDHGYLKFIEHWGSDERIVEAARMSTDKGFNGWGREVCTWCGKDESDHLYTTTSILEGVEVQADAGLNRNLACEGSTSQFWTPTVKVAGDEKLLKYLYENKHATPFEMAGMVIEVQAPIFVFREWHRHRTQCLAPETLVHFDMPKSVKKGKHTVFKQTIEELWRKWQPTVRNSRPERQTNSLHPRHQVAGMLLRNVDEEIGEIGWSNITDVVRGELKSMIKVTTTSGRCLTATEQHKVFTQSGWMPLGEAVTSGCLLAMEGTKRNVLDRWLPEVADLTNEKWLAVVGTGGDYHVSNAGRVMAMRGYRTIRTVVKPWQILEVRESATGYNYVTMRVDGKTCARLVHTMVLEAFVGPRPVGQEARHLNNNKADASLSNLAWGTAIENASDRTDSDRQQRLNIVYEEIVSVENVGTRRSYDLSVRGPWHNFIADGFVVHNSYNELSARYTPLPDLNYIPTVERLMMNSKTNRQAGVMLGASDLNEGDAEAYRSALNHMYGGQEALYQQALKMGVPKELARIHLPVGRYSRMRACANLRNWLAFLTLRMDEKAQWEIRQYANTVGALVAQYYPRTWSLFNASRTK